jgi:hypothetical protein
MNEIWHPCAGFETHYEVSNLGNVRSIDRVANNGHNNGVRKLPSKVLKPALGKAGYLLVSFCVDNVKSNHNIHRLVARAFIQNEANKPQVNHKDGNKQNNHVDNLEWVTCSENGLHAYRVLGNTAWNKGMKKQAIISAQQTALTALTARVEAQEVRLTSLEGAQA